MEFIVHNRGIEVNFAKIKAFIEVPPPKNIWELKGLQGRLAYTRRFISIFILGMSAFSKLMKKNAVFKWDQ